MSQASETLENGLYFRHWPVTSKNTPASSPKAVVILVHGLGEHCQRYESLAVHLNSAGYAVSSMDLPSHGKSDGIRGHINSFNDFEEALLKLHTHTQMLYHSTPLFLLGHSMGGLIATKFLLNHQDKFAGAMLSGAAILSPQEPPAWQVVIIKIIAKLFPKAPMLALDASAVSRDPKVVEKYMNDPLVSQAKLSAQFLVSMTNTMDECKDKAKSIHLPIKIMHGSADVMTAPQGSQLLYDSITSKDKMITLYEGLYHEIFNEPEAEKIFDELVHWMDQRIT